ncbi:MAG: HAD-IB family phosphatase [Candidatus Saccharimonadales bacterium]
MTIIFDFDGTIADSFDYVLEFLTVEAGVEPLIGTDRQAFRNLSMIAMARKLGHRHWKLPLLFWKGKRVMSRALETITPFDGMPEVIRKLHAEGHELFIVSSNSLLNIREFLHKYELHEYFLEIYGSVGMFGKAPVLRKLLREQHLELAESLYVGDEQRDVAAAQSIQMPIIAVLWGFARQADLRRRRPTALAETPDQIITIIEEL